MNPARSFGPALYTGIWDYQWVYWVAPLLAALITSVSFKLIFHREAPVEKRQLEEIPLRDNKNNV
jgi:aquaporin rerated protein, invertebrate